MSASDQTIAVPTDGSTTSPRGEFVPTSRTFSWTQLLAWVFSFPAMLAVLLVGAVAYFGRQFNVDPDLWWHIKTGQTILSTHQWPTTDPYSFTVHGQPWMAFEWLGDTLIAAVYRIGGLRGLGVLLIAVGAAVILSLYAFATLRSHNSKAGFVAAAMLCTFAFANFNLRSQMFGYLFLIITLTILELFREGKKWPMWLLPPLLLVWVNTHGSWIVGLGTIFVYWICGFFKFQIGTIQAKAWSATERRQISLTFLLSLVAVTITPYGAELAAFPFRVASSLPISVANIQEWQPMPFDIAGGKLFLILILGFFIAQMGLGLEWRLEELVLFAGGAYLATVHVRFLLVFVPFFAPLLATTLARWIPGYAREKDKYVLNAILMAGVIAAMVHYFPSRADFEKKVAGNFPVDAVAYIREHAVPRPMLNNYGFGGYLIWALGPQQKVFIDGRSEIYEYGGVLSDYVRLSSLRPGGLDILRRYQIESCLLNRNEQLSTVLAALPEWRMVYSDRLSILYVRAGSGEEDKKRGAMSGRVLP